MRPQSAANGFDFGSGQPLPPPRRPLPNPFRTSLFRSLAHSNDPELLSYITRRKITVGFLNEIDQLLRNNPELYYHSPEWSLRFNTARPLDAYKFFLKGYTKPARYLAGFLPDVQSFTLPQYFIPGKLDGLFDEELHGFFAGQEYRHDILQEIDKLVDSLCYRIQCGQFVKNADRRLVVYALWANPIDAFKYYEYSYQTSWLQHRYLPEHVELCNIPKGRDYTLPTPSVVDYQGGHHSHWTTRLKMAKANDEGVDVLDVLMQEFVQTLARKGHGRNHIESLRREARATLDSERDDPQGYDIVDLIMGLVDAQPRLNRPVRSNPVGQKSGRAPPGGAPIGGPVSNPGHLGASISGSSSLKSDHTDPVPGTINWFKEEPLTPQAPHTTTEQAPPSTLQPKKAPQLSKKAQSKHSRRHNYVNARRRLQGAKKDECAALRNGEPGKIRLATKIRIAAELGFVRGVLSWNKAVHKLKPGDVEALKRLLKSSKHLTDENLGAIEHQVTEANLLTRYGNSMCGNY
ncbi:hypothetical protein SLS56_000223 [Neofusicoccum ribis]|uniref:Uncharacterized protein n=1 Tax=Neofusicoccum ribis TaxID=45134 RepID=A0ABR3TGH2_9PEZI